MTEIEKFEAWIKTRKLITKYGASLAKDSTGESFVDVRVNGHWVIWQAARKDIKKLEAGVKAVGELIDESGGVYHLHLNGELTPWHSIRAGGFFEEWLREFDKALEVVEDSD